MARLKLEEVKYVDEFVYLGVKVSKDGVVSEDIQNRLRKTRDGFLNLTKLWSTRAVGKKTKIKLYKTLVRPIFLYGCETLKITKGEEKILDAFLFKDL